MTAIPVPLNTFDSYWGPAQVRLYVDGVWADDACAIQYMIQDNKVPKYGYSDKYYRTVAQGQTLVTGMLSINFRFNGYLRSVIEKQIRRRSDFNSLVNSGPGWPRLNVRTLEDIKNLDDAGKLETLAFIAQGYPPKDRGKVFDNWKDMIWGKGTDRFEKSLDSTLETPRIMGDSTIQERVEARSYQRPGLFTTGFDVMMVYGTDPENIKDPGYIRVIQDVHLTGEAQRIEIEVPDGGRAIREVYQFLARDVRAGEPNGAVPQSGGAATS